MAIIHLFFGIESINHPAKSVRDRPFASSVSISISTATFLLRFAHGRSPLLAGRNFKVKVLLRRDSRLERSCSLKRGEKKEHHRGWWKVSKKPFTGPQPRGIGFNEHSRLI